MSNPVYPSDPYVLNSISPYLSIKGASAAIEFYQSLFGAEVLSRMERNGIVFHAELKIGNTVMMLGEDTYDNSKRPVGALSLGIYVTDVDSIYQKALNLGACSQDTPTNKFWGDRMGSFIDPYGIRWGVSQRLRNLTQSELDQGLIDKLSQERIHLEEEHRKMILNQESAEKCHNDKLQKLSI
jgi:PhnB protein